MIQEKYFMVINIKKMSDNLCKNYYRTSESILNYCCKFCFIKATDKLTVRKRNETHSLTLFFLYLKESCIVLELGYKRKKLDILQ